MDLHRPQTCSEAAPGIGRAQIIRNGIPLYAQAALEQLYGHPFSTVPYQAILHGLHDVHTYVQTDAGQPTAVILFRITGLCARVLTEFAQLDEAVLRAFTAHVFAEFPDVAVITLHAVHTEAGLDDLVRQKYPDRADIVLDLPASEEAYHSALGRSTRTRLRERMNKLRREQPGFTTQVYRCGEITSAHVQTLFDFNRHRMQVTGKHNYNDSEMQRAFLRLAQECDAFVLLLKIDGAICAGSLNVCAGIGCFGFINSFDQRYARYSLGTLSAYLTTQAAIRIGARRFHFGWDAYDYKYHLLGVPRPSWRFDIYRSHLHVASVLRHAAAVEYQERLRRLKCWLRAPERRDSLLTRLAMQAINRMRDLKAMSRPEPPAQG